MRLSVNLAGLLVVVATAAAADLQCFVCDDCETEFKNTAQTCGANSGGESGVTDVTSSSQAETTGTTGIGTSSVTETTRTTGTSTSSVTETSGTTGTSTSSVTETTGTTRTSTSSVTETTTTTTESEAPAEYKTKVAIRLHRRSIQMDGWQAGARAGAARCVTASYEENGKTKVKRGCSLSGASDNERCVALIGNPTKEVKHCKVCEENVCNAAPRLALAIVPIVLSLFIHF